MFSYIDRTLAGLALIGTLLWTLSVLVPDVVELLGTNTLKQYQDLLLVCGQYSL